MSGAATRPILVAGIGNVLMGDDALGPVVIALLDAGWNVGPDVELLDAGTPGLDLAAYLAGRRAVVIVDAVTTNAPAGTLRVYSKSEILRHPAGLRGGPHAPAMHDTLVALELADQAPVEMALVGVVPESVKTGTGLTAAMQDGARRAVLAVVERLREFGAHVAVRAVPAVPNLWWEEPGPPAAGPGAVR